MEIDLLGRFAVRRGGNAVEAAEFGGRRVRQLIRILAAERGHVVSRDTLIETLWGEHLPADPGTNLNVVVNRARRALGEDDVLQTASGGYVLRDGMGVLVDVERFEELVSQARAARQRGDDVEAARAAEAALELWDEPLPEDAYADWAVPHRDRLERLHQDALEIGADGLLAQGRAREAVALAAQAVARQPLREAAYLLLVRAYAAEADQLPPWRPTSTFVGCSPTSSASTHLLRRRPSTSTCCAGHCRPERNPQARAPGRTCPRWSAGTGSSPTSSRSDPTSGSRSSPAAPVWGSRASWRHCALRPRGRFFWPVPSIRSVRSRGVSRGH